MLTTWEEWRKQGICRKCGGQLAFDVDPGTHHGAKVRCDSCGYEPAYVLVDSEELAELRSRPCL
jgi:rubredoxin